MDISAWAQVVVQVPALVVLGFCLTWMFGKVLAAILDKQGDQIQRMLDGFDRLSRSVEEMTRRCPYQK